MEFVLSIVVGVLMVNGETFDYRAELSFKSVARCESIARGIENGTAVINVAGSENILHIVGARAGKCVKRIGV